MLFVKKISIENFSAEEEEQEQEVQPSTTRERVKPDEVCQQVLAAIIGCQPEKASEAIRKLQEEFDLSRGNVLGRMHKVACKVRRHARRLRENDKALEAKVVLQVLELVRPPIPDHWR